MARPIGARARTRPIAIACATALLLSSCGDDEDSSGSPDDTPAASEAASSPDADASSAATDDGSDEAAGDFDPDAVLRIGVPGVAQSLDPRTANEFQQILLEQAYEPLIRVSEDGGYEPGLAVEWGLVDDSAAFELTLRDGVTFQDGEPVDAAAVVANLDGARAGGNLATDLAVIDSVEAVDDLTVRIVLGGPGGHLTGILAGYAGMMISPAALDRDLTSEPVGAGPFVVTEVGDTAVTYERWDGYYGADDVTIGGIEMLTFADENTRLRALVSGQLDAALIGAGQGEEAEAAGLTVLTHTRTSHHAVLVNGSNDVLGNDLVRQALMHAIDRGTIVEALYDGACTATAQPYASSYWAHNPELEEAPEATYDLDEARALLEEAGYGDGFDVTISSNSVTIYQRLAEVLQEQWADIGVDVEVRVSTDLTTERRNGDFDMVVGPFEAGRPDPTVFLANYYATDGPLNFGGIEFAGVEDDIVASRELSETSDRARPVWDAFAQIVEQGPLLMPICIPDTLTTTAPGVTGFEFSALGNRDFRATTISR